MATYWLKIDFSVPSLPMFPLEFCGEVKRAGNESWGYPSVKTPWS